MNNKTCIADPIPTKLIKMNLELLLPLFQHVINLCFSNNIFSNHLKLAYVTPIIKDNKTEHNVSQDYRLVSNLAFISKLLEKLIYPQLYSHVESNRLHNKYQSPYRNNHSCETPVLRIIGDIQVMLAKKSYAVLILLDSFAPFDTVDHKISFTCLNYHLGMNGNVLTLLPSYLSNRSFREQYGGRLEYFTLWCPSKVRCIPNCDIIVLHRTLNKAARYLFNLKRFERFSAYVFKLHIFPVAYKI